ncbi:unnamed protein product, partial [Oikopleura dioica]
MNANMFESFRASAAVRSLITYFRKSFIAINAFKSSAGSMFDTDVRPQNASCVETSATFVTDVISDVEMLFHVNRHTLALNAAIRTESTRKNAVFVNIVMLVKNRFRRSDIIARREFTIQHLVRRWFSSGPVKASQMSIQCFLRASNIVTVRFCARNVRVLMLIYHMRNQRFVYHLLKKIT